MMSQSIVSWQLSFGMPNDAYLSGFCDTGLQSMLLITISCCRRFVVRYFCPYCLDFCQLTFWYKHFFYVLLTRVSLYNLVNKANLVHNFSSYVSFFPLHVSGNYVPIIRRNNCVYATLGTCYSVRYAGWNHTGAQNMKRKEINILRKTVNQIGFIYKLKPAFITCHSLNENGFHYGPEGLKGVANP